MKFTNQQLGPVPLVNVVVPLKRSLGDRATFKTTLSEGEGGDGGGELRFTAILSVLSSSVMETYARNSSFCGLYVIKVVH